MTSVVWLRRDLRLRDHPALAGAARNGPVVVCFVADPTLLAQAGPVRAAWLAASLQALDESLGQRLCLRWGDPVEVVPQLAAEVRADQVWVSTETEPAGAARDHAVGEALAAAGIGWREVGSPYAVPPGQITNASGGGYKVFTAFARAWRAHGWPLPAPQAELTLATAPSSPAAWTWLKRALRECPIPLPEAGEVAAARVWAEFLATRLDEYDLTRDRPDLDTTSRLSPYLKFGVIHPRTLLADLIGADSAGSIKFVDEVAWREFYADVLWRAPSSLTTDLNPLGVDYDPPGEQLQAWRDGRTGYPIIDAGQRQLLATGWMHNRVRMISASFLTKDLHLWWPHGAAHFAAQLIDADLASNAHGWQWVAGTGTDAAPYFRVFNPTTQAERFDPSGDYVRRWVPELAHLPGTAAHRPWEAADGYAHGYPLRIVDHDTERVEAVKRYRLARAHSVGLAAHPSGLLNPGA